MALAVTLANEQERHQVSELSRQVQEVTVQSCRRNAEFRSGNKPGLGGGQERRFTFLVEWSEGRSGKSVENGQASDVWSGGIRFAALYRAEVKQK